MRHRSISTVMTPADQVVSVHTGTPYKQIAALLAEHRISAVPVLDTDSHVIGIVSEADLLAKESAKEPRQMPLVVGRKDRRQALAKGAATIAADLMTAPAVTVGLDEDVVFAARLMESRRVKRLPVTDEDGRLTGMVSRSDILRLFVRPDAVLRREILDDVIDQALWIDPSTVEVAVVDGVVHLRGELETRSLAELVAAVVGQTDGVVDVVSRLDWARDDTRDRLSGSRDHGVFQRR